MGVGEKLQEERLRQGFTLEEIEEETKIRKYYLQALEEENYKVLPPRVYATGFVRRYAKFLGLSETELANEFKQQAYGDTDEEQAPVMQATEPLTPINKVILPWGNIIAGVIFLVLAVWIGNGVISSVLLPSLSKMAQFRNILVHDYAKIEPDIIYSILKNNVTDLQKFIKEIDKALKSL
jgi:cytoskeletal protein RodZ